MHHFVYSIISDLKSQRVLILGGTTSCFQVKLGVAYVGKLHINDEVFNVMQGRIPDASSFLLPNPNCCCYKATRLGIFFLYQFGGAWREISKPWLWPPKITFSLAILCTCFRQNLSLVTSFSSSTFMMDFCRLFHPFNFSKLGPTLAFLMITWNVELWFVKSAWCLSNS